MSVAVFIKLGIKTNIVNTVHCNILVKHEVQLCRFGADRVTSLNDLDTLPPSLSSNPRFWNFKDTLRVHIRLQACMQSNVCCCVHIVIAYQAVHTVIHD